MTSKRIGWLALAAAVAACGGTTATIGNESGDGGGSDGGGGAEGGGDDGGTGGDASSPPCPTTPPTAGASCLIDGAACEYGNDPNEACNTVFVCSSGHWTLPPRGGCPPPGATCPASYGAVPVGAKCTPEFLTCEYPQGTCDCTRSGFGPSRLEPAWACTPTTAGCPSPRPRVGSACTEAGESCDYGACKGGVELACKGGSWQVAPVACPQ